MARKQARRDRHTPTLFINGKRFIKPQWRDYQWSEQHGKYVPTGEIAEQSNRCNLLGVEC